MGRELSAVQLAEQWTLDATDWEWLANKTGATRLGFSALLKFFAAEGRFPRNREELPQSAVHFLAEQVRVPAAAWQEYRWEGRTFEYHRAQVRNALGFREPTAEDAEVPFPGLRDADGDAGTATDATMSVPGHALRCGPETSVTSPLRRLWFELIGHEKIYIQSSRPWECGKRQGVFQEPVRRVGNSRIVFQALHGLVIVCRACSIVDGV